MGLFFLLPSESELSLLLPLEHEQVPEHEQLELELESELELEPELELEIDLFLVTMIFLLFVSIFFSNDFGGS